MKNNFLVIKDKLKEAFKVTVLTKIISVVILLNGAFGFFFLLPNNSNNCISTDNLLSNRSFIKNQPKNKNDQLVELSNKY